MSWVITVIDSTSFTILLLLLPHLSRSSHCFNKGFSREDTLIQKSIASCIVTTPCFLVISCSINWMRLSSSNAFDLQVSLSAIKVFKSKNPELCSIPPSFGVAKRMVLISLSCCLFVTLFFAVFSLKSNNQSSVCPQLRLNPCRRQFCATGPDQGATENRCNWTAEN